MPAHAPTPPTSLTPAMHKFILHWGQMGDRWGVNRSVAQIHALLYVTGDALSAEEIAEALTMARSNVSTSLRELLDWDIVRLIHKPGDRRDHYEALADPWETLDRVIAKRRQREIEPTLRLLAECIDEIRGAAPSGSGGGGGGGSGGAAAAKEDREAAKRLEALRDLLVQGDALCAAFRKLPRESLGKLIKAGGKLKDLLTRA